MSIFRRKFILTGIVITVVLIAILTNYIADFLSLRQLLDETSFTSFHMVCGLILFYTVFFSEATKKEEKKKTALVISEDS